MKAHYLVLFFLASAGCSLAPSREAWNAAEFGSRPDAKRITDDWIHSTFFDPESARIYSIEEPKRTCYHPGAVRSQVYGWSWFVDVNSKNRLGGYTGRKVYLLMRNAGGLFMGGREGANFNAGGREREVGDVVSPTQYYFREEHLD